MKELYNNQIDITSDLNSFFESCCVPLSKPNINNLSNIIFSCINSESVVTADIASSIKSNSFSNNNESVQKRIWRFFNNPKIDMYNVYDKIIRNVISRIYNVKHGQLIVTLDHMFTKNNFVILMFTLRIDNQGIPLWFRCERTLSNCHLDIQKNSRKKLFSEKFIKNAIDDVIELLSPLNAKIIFLADRWFFNLSLMKHIADKNCFYCFRAKANSNVKLLLFNKKEGHEVWSKIIDLPVYVHHSVHYKDLELGDIKLKCNMAISKKVDKDKNDNDEHWYIVTNLNVNNALKTYAKRFGTIEMFFKSQKTNGFYLEATKTKNLHAFENLYGTICIAALWLNIIGVDYIKNHANYKSRLNIKYAKKSNSGQIIRCLSTFKLGLTLFKCLINSFINIKLKTNFKLYL